MDFYEMVRQAAVLLQQQGKLTYRTLRRQFALDEETLEDLKEELLFSHPVVDEDGRGLVWTGETREVSAPTSQPDQTSQPEPQPVVEQAQPVQESLSPVEPHTPEAERRQLTVMFIDMVESTALSGTLDPEDYREVVRQYQQVCSEVIQRYDGHIAQYLGDGLLVYFGFPQAHEDDAQRAVRSGLGIIEAIGALNTRLEQEKDIKLAVRLGIHTGLVVVGEMGGRDRQEQLALGETPNLAARIQGLAEPDTMAISADTYRLIQGFFNCDSLGEHDLRGVVQPIVVYRVLQESGIQSRLDIESTRGLTPLVGRESEVTLLLERWSQVRDGQGQVVLVSGEAGIGKSRLVQVLKDHVVNEPHIRLECRSSPYFQNTALYPIIDLTQRTLRWESDEAADEKLSKLAQALSQYRLPIEESVPLMAGLLSVSLPEDKYPPLNLTPQIQRQKTLEIIIAIILELSEREPVLLIVEDLHWTDPSTLELLDLLIDQTPTASIYTLLTCRPEFQAQWGNRSYFTQVTLNRLSGDGVKQMATQVAGGKTLPDEVLQQLVEKTDGVPLYVEEMTKAVLESGVLKEVDGEYELSGPISFLTIPTTLQDSLMSRLDRLVTAKAVAQYAAVIGRRFSYELLQAVSQLNETMLQHELGRLVEAELVYQRGLPPHATYFFKHALVQDAAYQSLLRSTRQGYHQRIAQVLEEQFPETAETQPELMAHHYAESGMNEQAVGYWQLAGEKAIQRSANVEAIAHLMKGLELLKTLPDTRERAQHELSVLTLLGPVLMAIKGYGASEVIDTYDRARALCHHLGDTPQTLAVLLNLSRLAFVQAKYRTSLELGLQCLRMAQSQHQPMALLEAHRRVGGALSLLGELSAAQTHLEQAQVSSPTQRHRLAEATQDAGVSSLAYLAWTIVALGYPDRALACMRHALTRAQDLSHPFSLAFAASHTAFIHQLRREAEATRAQAEVAIPITTEQNFPLFWGYSMLFRGWARAEQGEQGEGIAEIDQGIKRYRSTGQENYTTYFLAILAEVYGKDGQRDNAIRTLNEAFVLVDTNAERYYEAELYRLKGELLLQQSSDATEAESCFHQAISIAQNQSAKSWELRAATSLARLWQSQGKREEARELLGDVYGWFTEGFDTADLKDAKALLGELEEGR